MHQTFVHPKNICIFALIKFNYLNFFIVKVLVRMVPLEKVVPSAFLSPPFFLGFHLLFL